MMCDVDGDGLDDLVGFGTFGAFISFSDGRKLVNITNVSNEYTYTNQ